MFGDELVQAMRGFKAIWDPDGKMNPGKVVDPYPLDANMKLGPDYRPPMVETHFDYRREGGSFADATVRCIGLGKCLVTEGQLMCPSYAATRDEEHSTRGRARLLFEMARGGGEAGIEMWRSEEVKRALDLCLSCKGCKTDCPTGVDMATYKAEFLAHHYEGRARPRQAYAMGLIPVWARLASRMPSAANLLTHGPGVSALVKRAGGIAPVREIPRFAPRTFKEEFFARPPRNLGRPRVLLWPDTFVNAFERGHRSGHGAGPGGGGLPGHGPQAVAVLRPAPVRPRDARDGEALAAPNPPRAAPGDPCRDARGRDGALVRGRVPGRAARAVPEGPGRPPPVGADVRPVRVPGP